MKKALLDCIGKLEKLKILVVGDLILDKYIWGDTSRISPEAPVPIISVNRETYTPGGAANVAANLTSLGSQCEVCGIVGDDADSQQLRSILKKCRVDFDSIFIGGSAPTIVKTRVITRNQQICRLDYEDQPEQYALGSERRLEYLLKRTEESDAVIISDYAKGVIHETSITAIQRAAHKGGALVTLDPKPKRELSFTGVDLMTPNSSEALELAGIKLSRHQEFPYEEVCKSIYKKYLPRNLVVTLGEDGMLLSENGEVVEIIPADAHEVYDVSGAGDTVIAVLTAALAVGSSLTIAARLANHAAGIVVSKVGAASVTADELSQKVVQKYAN